MTETIDSNPPAPAPEEAPKTNSFARIGGVLMSPGETFESIAKRPDWVVPLLIVIVISIVGGVILASRADFKALAREAMEMNPKTAEIPADRLEPAVNMSAAIMKMTAYTNSVLVVISLLIVAAVLLFSMRMFGGEGNFKQGFSVTLYAWMPRLIKGIIALVVTLSHSSISFFELQNPVASNLGFLVDPKSNVLLYTLLSSIDLFAIWSVILLIIGFAAVSRLSKGRAAGVVIGWWIVVNLLTLIGPAMQTLRR